MKKINIETIILIILVIVLFVFNYPYLDHYLEHTFSNYEYDIVTRIIDGDTIETLNHPETIRLLGINCPETGEKYSKEAKDFLENLVLHKKVKIISKEKDRYSRTLAYIYLGNKNINLELVKKGLANVYFPLRNYKNNIYYNKFIKAWKECINQNINLCEKSHHFCAKCIKLEELNYSNQKIIFKNVCNFSCELSNWTIKDEGRKIYFFPKFILNPNSQISILINERGKNTKNKLYWQRKTYVWTKTGDTLFLRDNNGYLVLWYSY